MAAADQLHDQEDDDGQHDQEGEGLHNSEDQILPEFDKAGNGPVEGPLQALPVGDLHDLFRIFKDLLEVDVDGRKIHVPVHAGQLGLLIVELPLHLGQALLYGDHILDGLRLVHHFQQALLFDLEGLSGGVMGRVFHADVAGADGSVGHLPVLLQVLHKGVEFFGRDPGGQAQVSAGPVGGRPGPVLVVPVGILVVGVLIFNEAAIFIDLVVNALGGLVVLQGLEGDISRIDDLAVGGLQVRRLRPVSRAAPVSVSGAGHGAVFSAHGCQRSFHAFIQVIGGLPCLDALLRRVVIGGAGRLVGGLLHVGRLPVRAALRRPAAGTQQKSQRQGTGSSPFPVSENPLSLFFLHTFLLHHGDFCRNF